MVGEWPIVMVFIEMWYHRNALLVHINKDGKAPHFSPVIDHLVQFTTLQD